MATDLPSRARVVVIGGGVIGLELGSVWRRLGAKVTVVEFLDQILPGMDDDVRKEANKIFKKQGFEFRLSTKVTKAEVKNGTVALTVEPAAGGQAGLRSQGRRRRLARHVLARASPTVGRQARRANRRHRHRASLAGARS